MFIIWWIGVLLVVGMAGDNLHRPSDGRIKRMNNYIPYIIGWPLILGQAVSAYITQWERYSVFRDTGIDTGEKTAEK